MKFAKLLFMTFIAALAIGLLTVSVWAEYEIPSVTIVLKAGEGTGEDITFNSLDPGRTTTDYYQWENGYFWLDTDRGNLHYKLPDCPSGFSSDYRFLLWHVVAPDGSELHLGFPGYGPTISGIMQPGTYVLTAVWDENPGSFTVKEPESITIAENAAETKFEFRVSEQDLNLGAADRIRFEFEDGDLVCGEEKIHYIFHFDRDDVVKITDITANTFSNEGKISISETEWQNALPGTYVGSLKYTAQFEIVGGVFFGFFNPVFNIYSGTDMEYIYGSIPITLTIPGSSVTVTAGDGGTASASLASGKAGQTVTLTADPDDGYRFREWQVICGGVTISDNQFVLGTEDVEIKAVFERIGLVIFKDWDGTELKRITLPYGEIPSCVDPERTSDDIHLEYEFNGWDSEIRAVDAETAVYTAQYKEKRYFFINFEPCGGSGTMDRIKVLADGTGPAPTFLPCAEYTLPFCGFNPPPGMAFDRWEYTGSGGTVTQYTAGWSLYNVTEDMTFAAKWKESSVTTGVYPRNSGTASYDISNGVFTASPYDGWYFVGWRYEDLSGIGPAGYVSVSGEYNPETINEGIYTACFAKPSFKTCSLVLSGQIGVNFYMDLNCLSDTVKNAGVMEFTVGGSPERKVVPFSSETNDNGYNRFTCYVSSIQMADTITAVYRYQNSDGKESTVDMTYSVQTYIESALKKNNSVELDDLLKAINDYGYYAQIYLSQYSKKPWVYGTDHAAMSESYTDAYGYTAEQLSGFAVGDSLNADISNVYYSLTLDSDTAVNLYVEPADGYTGDITAKLGEEDLPVVRTGGRYKITLSGISAHRIADIYTVTITTLSGDSTVNVSALSYAYAVLSSEDSPARDVMCALYDYYLKAAAYQNSLNGG